MPKRGVHRPLEEAANEMLRKSLEGVTSMSAKSDILTPWKDADRHRREVYVKSGTPDPAVRSGNFRRVLNPLHPHLNAREGHYRGRRIESSLGSFVERYHDHDDN